MNKLDEIQARAEAATPGPWEWDGTDVSQCANGWSLVMENTVSCSSYCYGGTVSQEVKPADAEFIANAHEDVSRLLAALDAALTLADKLGAKPEHRYVADSIRSAITVALESR